MEGADVALGQLLVVWLVEGERRTSHVMHQYGGGCKRCCLSRIMVVSSLVTGDGWLLVGYTATETSASEPLASSISLYKDDGKFSPK